VPDRSRRIALALPPLVRLVVALAAVAAATAPVGAAVAPADAAGADCAGGEEHEWAATASPASGAADADDQSAPAILSAYPNPPIDGDRGEFVVVALPGRGNWSLDDGERHVRLPANATGRVVLTAAPGAVPETVEARVVAVPELPALANEGETIRLRRDGREVHAIAYEDASEGELYRPGAGFEPLGATDVGVGSVGAATVTTFALPDAPGVPLSTIRDADRRVRLAAYTFTSERVADALVAAAERGVSVRVLVEGAPVGGVSARQARLLDRLVDAGIEVRAVGGALARVRYQHAKYAVVDDRAVVLSENWKPSGTGGHSSRGWGAVVHDSTVAAHLASVFRADAGWRDARPWRQVRRNTSVQPPEVADGEYAAQFEPRRVRADGVRVLVAPDNAERAVVRLVRSACETLFVQQVAVGSRRSPFLRAALSAARRGVEVRILLSSAWYVREDNRRLAAWLNRTADREGIDLTARLAEPAGRFGKIHNKGVVVDGERALVGSLNWNNHSARQNREVALVLEGEAAAGYYAEVFRSDWRRPGREVPAGLLVVVALAVTIAARWGYDRIEFERR
jgi:phosphatidylserine/phosphatidylglycerophosphate/cardiolipin synthase-like enzyme